MTYGYFRQKYGSLTSFWPVLF